MPKSRPPLSERMRIEKALTEVQSLSKTLRSIGIHHWIRDLRKQLHMTQKQLAQRAKVPQSHISLIESGKASLTLETAKKIFDALFCNILILPLPQTDLKLQLKQRAILTARKKIASISGTMALEDQLPDKAFLDKKIEELSEDLIRSGTTEIWD